MKNYYFLIFLTLSSFTSFTQEDSEECAEPSKKVQKLLMTAVNSKDAKGAVDNFSSAIKEAPESASVYFQYGMYAYDSGLNYYKTYPNPAMGDKSFAKAEEMFEKTHELCPEYNASTTYYLGVINYSQEDKKTALKWFKSFLAFKSNDPGRYPDDYSKKVADVKEVMKDLEEESDLLSNTVPFNPVLVKNVSTSTDEYFPMISPDNELIFYTRKLDRRNLGDMKANIKEEFTLSSRSNTKNLFDGGNPVKAPFNDGSFESYGAATLSVDNKEMIICACKYEEIYGQQYKNCDLYSTTYSRSGAGGNDYTWTVLENLGPTINTKDGWEGQPTLSADGNTLYYTVLRPSSQDNDIYISERQTDGTWGQAYPFTEINTPGKDKSPFLHQDSETLYFVSTSSAQRKGVGGTDIFYIRMENGKWSKPKNIGYPINSADDEIGLFVSTDGKTAYFSSRVGGVWNIYSFELYEEARPAEVAIIKGELKDENGEPVKEATIEIAYEGEEEVTQVKVHGDDGKYAAVVKKENPKNVMVTVKKEGHAFDSKLIAKEELAKNEVSFKGNDLAVKELKVGEAYTINDILYPTNSYTLSSRSKFILDGFARFLKENPTISVSINGHTDDVGDDAANLTLSENRAQGVKDYLISKGISAKRLNSHGFGETQPKLPNDSEAARAKNRRTDFVIDKL